jgi:hypothetical protein
MKGIPMQTKMAFIGVMILTASLLACAPAPSTPTPSVSTPPSETMTAGPTVTEPAAPMPEPTPPATVTPPTEPTMPPAVTEPAPPVTTEPTPPAVVVTQPTQPAPPTTTEPTPPATTPVAPTTTTTPAVTTPASSTPVNVLPLSYTATAGDRTYLDDTGKQLTDTVLGGDLFNAKMTGVAAYEWVGWANKDAKLSFEFGQERKFSKVRIGFNHNDGAGIILPKNVVINNQSFPLKGNEVANAKRGFVTFDVNFSASTVTIKLEYNPSRQWMMVDEVRFEAR